MASPLIVHVIHHLVIGGLENGLVNLINHMPRDRYRHAIICMKDYSEFRRRITRDDVEVFAMHKRDGQDFGVMVRLYRLFCALKPALVHSRNLTALTSLLPATLAGVRFRVHGEHGRDERDPVGANVKYQWLRRLHRPLISHYVPLSRDLEAYLRDRIGVPETRITRIYNGVDTEKFTPAIGGRVPLPDERFRDRDLIIIGTVCRMQPVKDPCNLVQAFISLLSNMPETRKKLRLAIIGDGPERPKVESLVRAADAEDLVWLPGPREDVASLMRGFDIFVLPSVAEGISNTILEAMATGLPIVATNVGGNGELVEAGVTGELVPARDPASLAKALLGYIENQPKRKAHGDAARSRVESLFSLPQMVKRYMNLYDTLISGSKQATSLNFQGR
jgi:sugar transferase (PEP-CTERM/EpsH1 system associated)